jgi:hypothetical protein
MPGTSSYREALASGIMRCHGEPDKEPTATNFSSMGL